jgi:post-segregation antitoxin (ccd killing protein)
MARLNVYLPDDLAAAARTAGLNISAVTQEALRRHLDARSTDTWLARLPPAPARRVTHDSAIDALDAVREQPPTRHA